MTFHEDPNRRPYGDPILDRDVNGRKIERTGMGWGIPIGLAALALLLGFFFLGPRERTTTVTTNAPVTTPAPVKPAPATPSPAPARPGVGG